MSKSILRKQIYDNYYVYSDGTIFAIKHNRFVKPQSNGNGYLKYVFWDAEGQSHQKYIHREVALAFIPGHRPGLQVDHIDRNKSNNDLTNLRWVTPSQNQQFKGKRYKDTRICRTYNPVQKEWARALLSAGHGIISVSKYMGIPRQTINNWRR